MEYSKILIFKYLLQGFGYIYFIMFRSKGYVLLVAKQKNLGGLFTRPNGKQKRKDLERSRGKFIRNMMRSRLQRGWSQLFRILFVSSV